MQLLFAVILIRTLLANHIISLDLFGMGFASDDSCLTKMVLVKIETLNASYAYA